MTPLRPPSASETEPPLTTSELDALRNAVGDSVEVDRLLRYPRLAKELLARKLLETTPAKRPPKEKRPRCGAKTRAGRPCVAPAVWDAGAAEPRNGRCRNHGGLSTGPKTPEGLQRSAEALRKARERKRLEAEERKQREAEASRRARLSEPSHTQKQPARPQVPQQPAPRSMSARERQLVREEFESRLALPVRAEPPWDPWRVLRGSK